MKYFPKKMDVEELYSEVFVPGNYFLEDKN
jgi:hypothetical protein